MQLLTHSKVTVNKRKDQEKEKKKRKKEKKEGENHEASNDPRTLHSLRGF